jgi:chorismate mutase
MDLVKEFRNHADQCRAMARATKDRESRASWNSLAERWQHCAEIAESTMIKTTNATDSTRTKKMRQPAQDTRSAENPPA